jgi:[NiFe] hydrogenase assembly HybE family chaperone
MVDRAGAVAAASATALAAAVAAERRGAELARLYREIARTRMAGIPLLHPGLAVEALGFEPVDGGRAAIGILLTPWFMNLVWLPLPSPARAQAHGQTHVAEDEAVGPALPSPGLDQLRPVGATTFRFIGAHEPDFGPYAVCSLFSPMHEFVDQAAAVATAQAVLDELRRPAVTAMAAGSQPAAATMATTPAATRCPTSDEAPSQAGRRALLFGRRAAPAASAPITAPTTARSPGGGAQP